MHKFKNIEELRLERERLYLKKEMLEDEIRDEFEILKESMKPFNMIKSLFNRDTHVQNGQSTNPVSSYIGSAVIDFLVSKLVLRKSSFIRKVLASSLIYATGPKIIEKFLPVASVKLKELLSNFFHNHKSHPTYEQSTAGNSYSD